MAVGPYRTLNVGVSASVAAEAAPDQRHVGAAYSFREVALEDTPSSRGRRTRASPYAIAFMAIGLAGLLLVVVYLSLPEAQRPALLTDVGRAAITFIPVAFVSVIVAELVRRRDADKVAREMRLEARRRFWSRAISAYHESKAVRSVLRGRGLRPDSITPLTPELVQLLAEQMQALTASQLAFAQLEREVETSEAQFINPSSLSEELAEMEHSLRQVVKEWEAYGPALGPGKSSSVFDEWPNYRQFVASADAERSDATPTEFFRYVERAIRREFGLSADPTIEG